MWLHRLAKGMRVRLRGREYEVEERLDSGDIKMMDIVTEEHLSLSESELLDDLFGGRAELVMDDKRFSGRRPCASASATKDVSALRGKVKKRWRYRVKYVEAINKRRLKKLTKAALEPVIEMVANANGHKPPSWRTVVRWFRDYSASGGDARSLVPGLKAGNRRRKLSKDPVQNGELTKLMEEAINESYLSRQRKTVKVVYDDLCRKIDRINEFRRLGDKLSYPHYSTLCKVVRRFDRYEVMRARYGKRIADKEFSAIRKGPRPSRALERIEIDHTKLDLFVIDEERGMPIGRPWLTIAIDVYSKTIVGFYLSFDPPSYLSVMQCLLHSIRPKSYVKKKFPGIVHIWRAYGIPELMVVDNGREFHSKSFEDACYQLGSEVLYAPIRHAWYKGSVERYFGTLNLQLLHSQPGTTFSNIFERGDYDSRKNALITFKALEEIVHKYIIDVYHESPHRGINDVPARVWDASVSVYPPALPRSSKDLEVLVGLTLQRTLTAKGIEFKGLFFNDNRLSLIRRRSAKGNQKVQIKVDPTDLSCIHVLDAVKREYLLVPAVNQEYAQGLTLWQHRVIVEYARQQVEDYIDIIALRRAKERINEIVAEEWKATKKHQTRQKLARLMSHSQRKGEITVGESLAERAATDGAEGAVAERPVLGPTDSDEGRLGLSNLGSALESDDADCGAHLSEADPEPKAGDGGDEEGPRIKRGRGRPRKVESLASVTQDAPASAATPPDIPSAEEGWVAGYDLPR